MKRDKTVASTTATILQILPSLESGGVERGTVDITEAIVNSGGRAIVVSSGGRLVPEIERAGGEHIRLPVNSKNPIRIFINSRAIASLVLAKGVDIIHARSRAPAWSALLAARRTNRKFVTTFHGTYNENNSIKSYYNSIMTRGDAVIAISAAGFRDFTRIASSDPTMWRDVFLANKEATLEILGRFTEELFSLQRAIRTEDGEMLFDYFTRTRAIRRGILEAGQDTEAPDFGRSLTEKSESD